MKEWSALTIEELDLAKTDSMCWEVGVEDSTSFDPYYSVAAGKSA